MTIRCATPKSKRVQQMWFEADVTNNRENLAPISNMGWLIDAKLQWPSSELKWCHALHLHFVGNSPYFLLPLHAGKVCVCVCVSEAPIR